MPQSWDLWHQRKRPRLAAPGEDAEFLARVGPGADAVAVDIGCGDGAWTRRLASGGWTVTGYDHSPSAIGQARRIITVPKPRYEIRDAASLRLEPGSVDLISCRYVLEYLGTGFLDRAALWLRPGGAVYVLAAVHYGGQRYENPDPYRREMTADQWALLGTGWSSCQRYSLTPRTSALVLRTGGPLRKATA
ncbi:class I SAM-dependent methyltransferase [Streptomyces sp. NPDC055078]